MTACGAGGRRGEERRYYGVWRRLDRAIQGNGTFPGARLKAEGSDGCYGWVADLRSMNRANWRAGDPPIILIKVPPKAKSEAG